MNAFMIFGIVISGAVNLFAGLWLGVVVSQIYTLYKGKAHKDDGHIIGAAKYIFERYSEKNGDEAP